MTVDVNEEWLAAAREVLQTDTDQDTINAALHAFALRKLAPEIVAAFGEAAMDYTDSADAWSYGGGRDLSRLAEDARDR